MDAVFSDDAACPPLITLRHDSDSSNSYALPSSSSSSRLPLSSSQSPDLQLALASMQGLLASVQGEKDPRCLVLALRIVRRALRFFTVPLTAVNDPNRKSGSYSASASASSSSSSSSSSSPIATNEDEVGVTMGRNSLGQGLAPISSTQSTRKRDRTPPRPLTPRHRCRP